MGGWGWGLGGWGWVLLGPMGLWSPRGCQKLHILVRKPLAGGKFASAEAAAPVLQGAPLGVRGDRSGPARHMVPKSGTTIDTHHRQITPRAQRRES